MSELKQLLDEWFVAGQRPHDGQAAQLEVFQRIQSTIKNDDGSQTAMVLLETWEAIYNLRANSVTMADVMQIVKKIADKTTAGFRNGG